MKDSTSYALAQEAVLGKINCKVAMVFAFCNSSSEKSQRESNETRKNNSIQNTLNCLLLISMPIYSLFISSMYSTVIPLCQIRINALFFCPYPTLVGAN